MYQKEIMHMQGAISDHPYTVCDVKELSADAIRLVAEKKIAVVRVKNYFSADLCEKVVREVVQKNKPGNFTLARHVQRIGMPHYDIVDVDSFQKYHNLALPSIRSLRKHFHPLLSPIDKLRLELDEVWPAGASLESLYGMKCFVGLCRIIQGGDGSVLEPHIDKLSRDSKDSYAANSLIGQLAANIYIATPDQGGELEIWMREPDIDEYEKELAKTGSYHVDRSILGKPDLIVRPEVGDLLLFSSRCYHAVMASGGGIRSSIASFIGYRGINQPLSFWS